MSGSLDQKWEEMYRNSIELVEDTPSVFTGFNTNIDIVHTEKFDLDQPAEMQKEVKTMEEMKSMLRYCKENGENHEVDYTGLEIEGGEKHIGGQGGIISNFLAETGAEVILYTPHLSEELAKMMSEQILYPVKDKEKFYLKNIQDAVNSEKTKKNHIFEFEGDQSGRLILSGRLRGYGPYLPKDLEEELPLIHSNIECCIFSGFHNVTGNKEAKLRRSGSQLSRIEAPIHLEYVHKDRETSKLILEDIIPEVDSLGLDETELKEICEILGITYEENPNFGEAFNSLKQLREELDIERIHLHTYNYHMTVMSEEYPIKTERVRECMLYGELSAIQLADKDRIPDKEDIQDFSMEEKKIQDVKELKDFADFHSLERFAEEGTANIEGIKLVGIPAINHHNPERTVGMGDLISSGAFSRENLEK